MNQSESIATLAGALAKAQGVMEGASKDTNNAFFKSKYADLSAVWDACRKPLSDNGLSVVQTSRFMPEHPEMVCIETKLMHSSGEWISGELAIKPTKTDPQGVGSTITYLRRYSLQSMVGIAPEDDDGNAASGKGDEGKREEKRKPTPPPRKQTEDVPEFEPPPNAVIIPRKPVIEPFLTPEEQAKNAEPDEPLAVGTELRATIDGLIWDAGIDAKEFKQWLFLAKKITKKFGHPSLSSMSIKDAEGLVSKWKETMQKFNLWVDKQNEAA